MVSQLVDTAIFFVIAFYGVLPIAPLIVGTWLVKMFIAVIDTPFIYAGVYLFGRKCVSGSEYDR